MSLTDENGMVMPVGPMYGGGGFGGMGGFGNDWGWIILLLLFAGGGWGGFGGYSQHGNMVEELREMMMDAPNEEIRREYEKIINRMESNM